MNCQVKVEVKSSQLAGLRARTASIRALTFPPEGSERSTVIPSREGLGKGLGEVAMLTYTGPAAGS